MLVSSFIFSGASWEAIHRQLSFTWGFIGEPGVPFTLHTESAKKGPIFPGRVPSCCGRHMGRVKTLIKIVNFIKKKKMLKKFDGWGPRYLILSKKNVKKLKFLKINFILVGVL